MKKLTLQEFQTKINQTHPKEQLIALSYQGDDTECQVQCAKCGTIYTKVAGYFKDKRKISICKNCWPTQLNILKTDYQPRAGYKLIGKYTGMQNKVLMQHENCGFIWSIKPNNLEHGKGCPKCNKKISKGEQKIITWLTKNLIEYLPQYKIDIEGHHLSVDFYLPQLDLYIEYNGEQHYNAVAFFGGETKFKKQQRYDELKHQLLKDKLLVISYKDFDNIENILESSTTIPKGSTL